MPAETAALDRDGDRRQTLIDAALAAGTLAVVVAVGLLESVRPSPPAAAVGALATVLFEAATLSNAEWHRRIRTAWERPAARLGTVLAAGGVVVVGVDVAPVPTLSVLAGALVTYLLFVAAVAVHR